MGRNHGVFEKTIFVDKRSREEIRSGFLLAFIEEMLNKEDGLTWH